MAAEQPDQPVTGLALLLGELRPDLLRFLTVRLGGASEAEDVLQDLWLRIRHGGSGPITDGRAYLYRAAQNLALDRVRERQRRGSRDRQWAELQGMAASGPESVDPRPGADAALVEREEAQALADAISALPEAAQRAFRMHKLEGMPHADVAKTLGISRSGVEKHMALAMARLRRALATEV